DDAGKAFGEMNGCLREGGGAARRARQLEAIAHGQAVVDQIGHVERACLIASRFLVRVEVVQARDVLDLAVGRGGEAQLLGEGIDGLPARVQVVDVEDGQAV